MRHYTAERGSGSGDGGTSDSMRNLFVPQLQLDGRKSKNRRFLAAFFSIFLSLLKEIWPPEAYMQDAGAARNRRTENGPSGTPAPMEDQAKVRRYSKVRRCGPSGTPAPTRVRPSGCGQAPETARDIKHIWTHTKKGRAGSPALLGSSIGAAADRRPTVRRQGNGGLRTQGRRGTCGTGGAYPPRPSAPSCRRNSRRRDRDTVRRSGYPPRSRCC